jgi:hypothetical protein
MLATGKQLLTQSMADKTTLREKQEAWVFGIVLYRLFSPYRNWNSPLGRGSPMGELVYLSEISRMWMRGSGSVRVKLEREVTTCVEEELSEIHPGVDEIIRDLLHLNPQKRISIAQAVSRLEEVERRRVAA